MRLLRRMLAISALLAGYSAILIALGTALAPGWFTGLSPGWVFGLVAAGLMAWWAGCRLANGSPRSLLGDLPRGSRRAARPLGAADAIPAAGPEDHGAAALPLKTAALSE
jgi:hypothetical protein